MFLWSAVMATRNLSRSLHIFKLLGDTCSNTSCDYNALVLIRRIHVSSSSQTHQEFKKKSDTGTDTTSVTIKGYFGSQDKNKDTFIAAIETYRERERHLRGHVEFIYAAMRYMEEFGVEKDLEVYKSLLNLMPKGKMIPQNMFQEEFMHYPKHQQCAIDVLEKMEQNGVMPDIETQHILVNCFGRRGHPVRKFLRMMYWIPKFKNASPWALPEQLPNDALELAKLAVARMSSVDPATKVTVLDTKKVEDAIDDTWIVSGQSPMQQELLASHSPGDALKVEGPFGIFLKNHRIAYFVLRAEYRPPPAPVKKDPDDVSNIIAWMMNDEPADKELGKPISIHEQEDGTIMAICATGTSSRDSLLSWIRLLQESNPSLEKIPVLFTQASPLGDIVPVEEDQQTTDVKH